MELGFPRGLGQNQNQAYGHRHPPVQQNSKPSEGQLPNFPYSVMDARSIPRTLGPAASTPGPSILEQQHQQHSSSTSSSTTPSSIPPTGRPTSPPVAATGTAAIHSAAAAAAAAGSAEVGQQSADSLAHGNGNGNGNGENWASRVLQEMKDLMLLLNREGRVLYASPSCVEITGFEAQLLEKSDLFRYVHEDDKSVLTQELKECIETGRLLRCHFRFCKPDSSFCLLEAHGHPHIAPSDPSSMPSGPGGGNGGRSTSASSISASSNGNNGSSDSSSNGISSGADSNVHRRLPRPLSPSPPQQLQQQKQSECRGIFLVCRPYPTRGAQLLNSFLEHKIENIRLNQRIAQLKEEEEEELNATQQSFNNSNSGAGNNNYHTNNNNNRDGHFVHTSTTTTRQTYITTTQTVTQSTTNRAPARDTPSTSGEDNESSDTVTSNADDADSRSFPGMEGVMDRLPAVDDMSHIEGIEVMTGLYYGEGERSQGLSTGQKHGRLVHYSDIDGESSGNDPQASRGVGDGDRRKRLKGEYMCTDCGTSDSPEWRKGPEGPKTLCNACGLRWAKKEKKRQDP